MQSTSLSAPDAVKISQKGHITSYLSPKPISGAGFIPPDGFCGEIEGNCRLQAVR
jgi:hypothetical protein